MCKENWNRFILAWEKAEHVALAQKWEILQLPQCILLAAPPACFRFERDGPIILARVVAWANFV